MKTWPDAYICKISIPLGTTSPQPVFRSHPGSDAKMWHGDGVHLLSLRAPWTISVRHSPERPGSKYSPLRIVPNCAKAMLALQQCVGSPPNGLDNRRSPPSVVLFSMLVGMSRVLLLVDSLLECLLAISTTCQAILTCCRYAKQSALAKSLKQLETSTAGVIFTRNRGTWYKGQPRLYTYHQPVHSLCYTTAINCRTSHDAPVAISQLTQSKSFRNLARTLGAGLILFVGKYE